MAPLVYPRSVFDSSTQDFSKSLRRRLQSFFLKKNTIHETREDPKPNSLLQVQEFIKQAYTP